MNGGPALSAEVSAPANLTFDAAGTLYFDACDVVLRVSASGATTVFWDQSTP